MFVLFISIRYPEENKIDKRKGTRKDPSYRSGGVPASFSLSQLGAPRSESFLGYGIEIK
jgi:hypothetical protein